MKAGVSVSDWHLVRKKSVLDLGVPKPGCFQTCFPGGQALSPGSLTTPPDSQEPSLITVGRKVQHLFWRLCAFLSPTCLCKPS